MGRLIGLIGSLLLYLCLGTVIAQAIVLVAAWMHGSLDKEKLTRIADVMRGIELAPAAVEKEAPKAAESTEQPSLAELERQRGVRARHLELREQSVQDGLQRIRSEQLKLSDERDQYELLKKSFEKVLKDKQNSLLAGGREKMRLIWENVKPKVAKDQILAMIGEGQQDEAVAILSSIAIGKQAKIISEFKTDDEKKKMEELTRLIRQGIPDILPIDQAREDLKKFNPQQPPQTANAALPSPPPTP